MEDAERITIHTSRLKVASMLIANLVFGTVVLIRAKERFDWLLYGFALFFFVMSALALWAFLFRRAMLTLDAEGIHLVRGNALRWALRWSDVAQVHFVDTRINGVRTNRALVLVDRQGQEHSIAGSLRLTPDELAALVATRILT